MIKTFIRGLYQNEFIVLKYEVLDLFLRPINLPGSEYTLFVNDENNCLDSAKYTITEPIAPTLSFSNVSPVKYFGETNGQATITSNQPIANILWSNGETTATATGLAAQTYKVTLINDIGCESIDSISITQPNSPLVANIDILEEIACGGDTNGVLADASFGGNSNYEYIWSNGSTDDFIDNLPAGTYELIVQDEKGCIDDTTVTLQQLLPLDAMVTSQDVSCPLGENSGIITFSNPIGGVAPYQFFVNNQNFGNVLEIPNLSAGDYTLLMVDDIGCKKTFDPITIINPREVTVNLGPDLEIILGQTIELKATTNHLVSYEWFSTEALDCLDCATIRTRPLNSAQYSVIVTDATTGCTAEDELSIAVRKDRKLFVPNTFSPNGDGTNDQLSLHGGEGVTRIIRFEIYSRNGALVYKRDNFTLGNGIGWDGEHNGQQLPSDIFIYFVEVEYVDKNTNLFQGDFTLVR